MSESQSQTTKTDGKVSKPEQENKNEITLENLKVPERVKISKIKEIINDTLSKRLELMQYEVELVQITCKEISDLIKSQIKELGLNRYKCIVQTHVIEQKNQGIRLTNKCFWDHKTDHCISGQFKSEFLLGLVTVYLIYVYSFVSLSIWILTTRRILSLFLTMQYSVWVIQPKAFKFASCFPLSLSISIEFGTVALHLSLTIIFNFDLSKRTSSISKFALPRVCNIILLIYTNNARQVSVNKMFIRISLLK